MSMEPGSSRRSPRISLMLRLACSPASWPRFPARPRQRWPARLELRHLLDRAQCRRPRSGRHQHRQAGQYAGRRRRLGIPGRHQSQENRRTRALLDHQTAAERHSSISRSAPTVRSFGADDGDRDKSARSSDAGNILIAGSRGFRRRGPGFSVFVATISGPAGEFQRVDKHCADRGVRHTRRQSHRHRQ